MAGYRRFVAYVYEYRKGRKEANCGFIRVEVRDQRCRMEIHLRCPGLTPTVECRIYGFVRNKGLMDASLIGVCRTREGGVEHALETNALNVGDSGVALGKMGGMILRTESGAFFGTEWDDQSIRPEHFREVRREAAEEMSLGNEVRVKAAEESARERGENVMETGLQKEETEGVSGKAEEKRPESGAAAVQSGEAVEEEKTEAKPEVQAEEPEEVKPEVQPEATGEEKPEVRTEVMEEPEEVRSEVQMETAGEMKPEVQPEMTKGIKSVVQPEATAEVQLEVQPEMAEGLQSEMQPEATVEVQPGVQPETAAGIQSEIQPEAAVEVQSGVQTQEAAEIQPEDSGENTEAGTEVEEIVQSQEVFIQASSGMQKVINNGDASVSAGESRLMQEEKETPVSVQHEQSGEIHENHEAVQKRGMCSSPEPSVKRGPGMRPMPAPPQRPSAGMVPMPAPPQRPSAGMGPMPTPPQRPSTGMGPIPAPSQKPGAGMFPMPKLPQKPGPGNRPMPGPFPRQNPGMRSSYPAMQSPGMRTVHPSMQNVGMQPQRPAMHSHTRGAVQPSVPAREAGTVSDSKPQAADNLIFDTTIKPVMISSPQSDQAEGSVPKSTQPGVSSMEPVQSEASSMEPVQPEASLMKPVQSEVSLPESVQPKVSLSGPVQSKMSRAGKFPGEACEPFSDGFITECRKIQMQDLRRLDRRDRALGGNRFLQHGYYSFGHLLLGRTASGQYILGVPGGYDQQERFMANMFGFPYFRESPQVSVPRGKGGYWYRSVNPPDLH